MQSYINVNLESSGRIESLKKRKGTSSSHHNSVGSGHPLPPPSSSRERLKYWLRKLITLLFSQVGVGSLLVCYTILGAMLFISIESGVDSRRLAQVALLRSSTVLQLWNVTQNYNVLYGSEWREDVDQIVRHFQNHLVQEIKLGYEGRDAKLPWTFPQALMFSLSVYTTIGYGNLTPKTDWGKATTCIYAMFGIPLLLLYMANVGDLLATSFQQFYRTLNRCKKRLNAMREVSRKKRIEEVNKKYNPEGVNEQKESLLIVGIVRESKGRSAFTSTRMISKQKTTSIAVGDYAKKEKVVEEVADDGKQIGQVFKVNANVAAEDNNEGEGNEVTTIPISTCLAVFFCYILFGSILFSWWEGWEYFEGSYFCFVSLVTIGFSDIVPGESRGGIGLALSPRSIIGAVDRSTEESINYPSTNVGGIPDDPDAFSITGNFDGIGSGGGSNGREEGLDHHVDGQLILCSVYILFGMALMAMCFHLTQERFFATAKKLGKTLHLTSNSS